MDKSTWKSIAIVNFIITIIALATLVYVSFSFKQVIKDMTKNESSQTRVEVKYMTKIIDDIEFVYPENGIIRDTETNDDMIIDRFDIVEIIREDENYDIYTYEFAGANFSDSTVNVYFDEYDSEGFCIEEYQSQVSVVQGERVNKRSTVAVNKDACRIVVRFQENAEINFN